MVPVGEGRAKVVTPLTDIQLLQPVTATMLGKGGQEDEEVRKKERMEDGEWKEKGGSK